MNYKACAALAALLCAYVAVAALVPSQQREVWALEAQIAALRARLEATRDCRAPVPPPIGQNLAGAVSR